MAGRGTDAAVGTSAAPASAAAAPASAKPGSETEEIAEGAHVGKKAPRPQPARRVVTVGFAEPSDSDDEGVTPTEKSEIASASDDEAVTQPQEDRSKRLSKDERRSKKSMARVRLSAFVEVSEARRPSDSSSGSETFDGGDAPNEDDIEFVKETFKDAGGSRLRGSKGRITEDQKRRTMAVVARRQARITSLSRGSDIGAKELLALRKRSTVHNISMEQLAEDITNSSGVVVEYILRTRARLAREAKDAKKGGKKHKEHEVEALGKFLSALSSNDFQGYEYAGTHILIEKLTCDVMTAVTNDAKRSGIWKATRGHAASLAVMRSRALQIRTWKKEEVRLRADVDNFIMRYKLLHNKVLPMSEDMWERKARLEEFWTTFHAKKENSLHNETPGRTGSAQPWESSMRSATPGFLDTRRISGSTALGSPRRGEQADIAGRTWPTVHSAGTNARATAGAGEEGRCLQSQQSRRLLGSPRFRQLTQLGHGGRATPQLRSKQTAQSSSLPNLHGGASKHASSKTSNTKFWDMSARPNIAKNDSTKLPALKGHQKRYLQECDTFQRVPIPLAFVTGHSKKLEANGRDLVDKELMAMAGMMKDAAVIEVTDLSSNSLLSDAGLVPFLQQLSRGPAVRTLQQLLLSNCIRAGVRTVEGVMQLIGRASSLRLLDLSHVPLNTRLQVQMCRAIGEHKLLETINLADTGMNSSYVSKLCIGELVNSKSIRSLDLSWNCFSSDTFLCLGEALTKSSRMRSLKLTNCSATVEEGKDTPISLFLESLSSEKGLTKLDVSMNRINHQTFLIIEDSLDRHPKLQELIVSNNALGVHGIRSALRLMSRETNDITKIQLEGCFTGAMGAGGEGSEAVFSATSPGGRYVLFLDRACHRSLLRMLYRLIDKFGLSAEEAFSNIDASGKKQDALYTPINASAKAMGKPCTFSHPAKGADGTRTVPVSGKLELVLNMQRCIEKAISGLEEEDCEGFLTQYFQIVRYEPGWKKAIPIFATWKMIQQSMMQQQVFLDSFAKDFCLTVPRLAQMCASNRLFAKDTLWRMMPCVPNDPASRFMGHMIAPSLGDFLWTHQRMQALLNFNAGNPTGHYTLSLDNCCDYAVADRLFLLDRWESAIDSRGNYFDTSKWGNRSHFRNELYRKQSIIRDDIASMAEWTMPETGELEFDYVTNRRPRIAEQSVSDKLWDKVLISLYDAQATLEGTALMQVVRRVSHNIHLTSMHMRKMLGYFKVEEHRAECFVIFFFRIVDICNAKIFSCRFSKQEEVVKLQERLGYVSFFPFLQPENVQFSLDFAYHDQRLCANLLVKLALMEKQENLRNPQVYKADGSLDPDVAKGQFLARWQFLDKMPTEGKFVCNYVCAPENRKYEPRRRNAETYGHYKIRTAEADVQWWTGLLEVPDDVLRFMEFIINHYDNIEEVFTIIDGSNGNGQINFQEMKDGFKKMKFRKFEGKDEHDRILSVFRYLDPGGEGSISKQEWNILNQLWREFDMSVREFVHFMVIAFGEDLDSCWEVIDPMDTGTVNLEQWMSAVEDVGFTGPAEIIYALLDSSDDGDISYNEFSKLWDYMPSKTVPDSDSDESDHIVRGTDSISVALRGRNSQPVSYK